MHKILGGLILLYLLLFIAFWGGVGYLAYHFISKLW